MIRNFLPVLATCIALQGSAQQHYGDVWQFGFNVGLDFSACDPVVVSGSNAGFEGCASVCDESGHPTGARVRRGLDCE